MTPLEKEISKRTASEFWKDWKPNTAPRLKRKPSVWAKEVRIMPAGGPISGNDTCRYSHAVAPHAVEIMDAADDPGVRIVVNWSAVRDMKTEICLNIMGRTVTDAPGGIFDVHPIDDDVAKFSNDSVEPMIDLCLEGYFVDKKSRDTGRTIHYKKFKGGSLRIVNAGSLTKFRGSTVVALFMHEVDGYVDREAIYKAINRTKGIRDAIIFLESTGTHAPEIREDGSLKYNSVIHEFYEKGDMRKWFVRCQKCGEMQWMKYAQIRTADGDYRNARYHCERCNEGLNERQWRKMVWGGIWYPTAGLSDEDLLSIEQSHHDAVPKEPEVRSYWRNGFNSLLPPDKGYTTKLHEFLAQGESAKSSKEALKTWTNEIAAELWRDEALGEPPPPWKPLHDAREDYGLIIPKGGLFLTAFADIQKMRIEIGWEVYGRNEESWGMDHVVIDGYVAHPEVWRGLRRELARKFKHESGAVMGLGFAFIDGGAYAEEVYKFFQDLARNPEPGVTGHCQASKGMGKHPFPIVTRGNMVTVAKNLKGRYIGTWQAKDRIYDRLRMVKTENDTREGIIHHNKQYGEQWFQGLTMETAKVRIEGSERYNTYRDEVTGNEPLDIKVGCLAAFLFRPKNLDALESEILESAKPPEQKAKPAEEAPQETGNWVTGGMKW